MITFTDIDALLRKVIAPRVEAQYPKGTVLLDALPSNKATKDPINNKFYISLKYSRNAGIAPLTSGFALPAAGQPKFKQANVEVKFIAGRFQIPEPVLDAAKGNKQALVNVLTDFSDDLIEGLRKDTNRMLYGDGSATLALADGDNVTTATTALTVDTPGSDYLYEGTKITINGQNTEISAVISDTEVTLADACTWDDNDAITKQETAEWMGLKGIVSDSGTIQGIDRASYGWWKAGVDENAEALSLADMQKAFRSVEKYGSVKLIVAHPILRDHYCDLLASYKKVQPATENKWGYKGPEYNQIAVIGDFDCPKGTMYFLDTDALSREQLVPVSFMDREGHVLKSISGYAAYEAIGKNFGNLAVNNCRKLYVLRGKT